MFIFLMAGGCNNTNEPNESSPDPTIVFGESIAQVQIGDDSSLVVRKLGKPTGIGHPDFKGVILDYTEGIFSKTSVVVSHDPGSGLGVIAMSIDSPYTGKSKEGIGINSERDFVISKLGLPDTTTGYDIYYYPKNTFIITYAKQRIVKISMSNPRVK
jgi:hypothetical protein